MGGKPFPVIHQNGVMLENILNGMIRSNLKSNFMSNISNI